jgi:outer membrane receptor protein involved in Fe transport
LPKAYAQGEFELAEKWQLTAGARFVDEKVDFTGEVAFLAGAPDYSFVTPLSQLPNPATGQTGKLDDTHVIGRVALDFIPSDNTFSRTTTGRTITTRKL